MKYLVLSFSFFFNAYTFADDFSLGITPEDKTLTTSRGGLTTARYSTTSAYAALSITSTFGGVASSHVCLIVAGMEAATITALAFYEGSVDKAITAAFAAPFILSLVVTYQETFPPNDLAGLAFGLETEKLKDFAALYQVPKTELRAFTKILRHPKISTGVKRAINEASSESYLRMNSLIFKHVLTNPDLPLTAATLQKELLRSQKLFSQINIH